MNATLIIFCYDTLSLIISWQVGR